MGTEKSWNLSEQWLEQPQEKGCGTSSEEDLPK